mmetsp:Transcript_19612/g.35604  ORF Transcript_19612/g.35604 Transcript_19612/m.35604 type:complete len:133 (-) Transcript_19612:372-770(-)|eukprot:CAMPEP_0202509890 /NCGR_PEP_ID=MMETSP1361-20130828/53006_1 /ASSEMBLY_ACC=CAM_ASM_000849 /TAXON_ID=210615 /ORGANISM="Staurosira complex sp., Strain CCMP2646" /LENGTH=132 /DNA_ID=CAMNT_0049144129 /DNA_START=57 /DNA_END=455 /DNA_ORIENTATION=-
MSSSVSNNTATTFSHSSVGASSSNAAVRYPKKIFMNVSPATTEIELRIFMECIGEVTSVKIPQDDKGKSRGFAFVTFRRNEDAAYALEQLEGHRLDGLILHPRWAAPKRNRNKEPKKQKRNGSAKRKSKKAK